MGVHTTKSRLPINSRYRFSFFPRYFYIKKWQLSIFLLFKGERHVWMTSIKVITKFPEVLSRFKENKTVINISSVKNWFKFFWALLKLFDFIKWQEKICHSRSKRKVSCQQYTNSVWFILLLIVVSKFVLIGQSFMKNLVFWDKFFLKNGYPL